jgi:uncharacterized protein
MLSPGIEAPVTTEASAPSVIPRFCNRCGQPRDNDTTQCASCAAQSREADAKPAVEQDLRSLKAAIILYFALLGVSIVLMVWGFATEKEPSAEIELIGSALFSLVVLGAVALTGTRSIAMVLTARFHPGWFLFAMGAALPTYLLASGAVQLLYDFGIDKAHYVNVFLESDYGFGWAVLAVCLQPALFEEIAFRGIIQGSLGRILAEREALIVSALMFGILHLSIPSLPHLLAMGLVLGWLRLKSKSLIPGMVLHFTHNFFVVVTEQTGTLWPW